MSKRMNWRTARLSPKRSVSVKDETEYRGQDAAARWLEHNEKKAKRAVNTLNQGGRAR